MSDNGNAPATSPAPVCAKCTKDEATGAYVCAGASSPNCGVPAPAPVIAFADAARRSIAVDLDYPLTVDGVLLDRVMIRRLSTKQVSDHIEMVRNSSADPDATFRFPMFFDAAGNAIPDAVLDALDDDDTVKIEAKVADFLPRRYRATATD